MIRWPRSSGNTAGSQAPQANTKTSPGSACPIHQAQGRDGPGAEAWRPALVGRAPLARELRGQRLDRASCHDDATLGFEHRACDIARIKVRIASAEGGLIEQLDRVGTPLKRRERLRCVRVAVRSDP